MKRHLLTLLAVILSLSVLTSSFIGWPFIEKCLLSKMEGGIHQTSMVIEDYARRIHQWETPMPKLTTKARGDTEGVYWNLIFDHVR